MFSLNLLKKSCHVLKDCLKNHKVLDQMRSYSSYSYVKNEAKNKQNLVIDLSFEDLMTTEECHRLAIDLYSVHLINSSVPEERQFKLNLCHQFGNNSLIIEYLRHYLPNLDNFHIHKDSYLRLFANKSLVYLSPNAEEAIDFNCDEVYVIGGIVQKKIFKRDSNRFSYSKAKSEGIRTGRLPIDHLTNHKMKRGIILFVPQVFSILSDIKSGESWEETAHKNIPYWKLKPSFLCHSTDSVVHKKSLKLLK